MRILMLGWEFPPFIAGGLGTACFGLTRALDRLGHRILFILPQPVDAQRSHVELLSPMNHGKRVRTRVSGVAGVTGPVEAEDEDPEGEFSHTVFRGVSASFTSPYPAFNVATGQWEAVGEQEGGGSALGNATSIVGVAASTPGSITFSNTGHAYGSDLVGDAERYARLVVAVAHREAFDVIHAHDWLTFPAGSALSQVTGKPWLAHVHSTEYDRSGDNINRRIYEIERRGMHAAGRVIAVSAYTKSICATRYAVNPSKVDVVYNGIDDERHQPQPGEGIRPNDRIVLFLGRITMQKGPEYFIQAAKRVLEKVEDVKFVVAGSGDMATRMIELAASLGIGHKVLFTGFLRGPDVERVFRMADCYVMPSVSEPFGLVALEALKHDVPVIISKQSGVSEVLTHVLKVDFWDIDEMANKIIAVLRHPPLGRTMVEHGSVELHRLTWEVAAEKCLKAYGRAASTV